MYIYEYTVRHSKGISAPGHYDVFGVLVYMSIRLCAMMFLEALNLNRVEIKKLQNWQMPFATLKAHMTVKTQSEPAYKQFLKEIEAVVKEQEAFITDVQMCICVSESLPKTEERAFSRYMQHWASPHSSRMCDLLIFVCMHAHVN